ncbi:MAG: IgGFc-binding protein [Myxococcales bacterium]|nr:IgGFc-binding protein [Myxococcales bacterium]
MISAIALGACGDSDGVTETDSSPTTSNSDSGETTGSTSPSSGTMTSSDATAGPGTDTGSETSTTDTTDTTSPNTTNPNTTEPIETSTTGPVCQDGEISCQAGAELHCEGGEWGAPIACAMGCIDGEGCIPCEEGEKICDGDAEQTCEGGEFSDPAPCDDVCVDGVGCALCEPGAKKCEGGDSYVCAEDGAQWELLEICDPVQGVFCNEDVGVCDGVCAVENLQLDYIGCEYYAVVTQHFEAAIPITNPFNVSISNTTNQVANVKISGGALNNPIDVNVAANSVALVPLPWVDALYEGTGPTVLAENGGYWIRSNRPVTVVQYSPLQADDTNDASLLLPTNAWDKDVLVAAFPAWVDPDFPQVQLPGFYAVVASRDNTTVTLSPSATGGDVQPGAGVSGNGTGEVMLNRGDVLQVVSKKNAGDVTGTIVSADQPISIIAGHTCTEVPQNVNTCDHLEESMPPIVALSKEYVIVPPAQVPNDNLDKAQVVRVVATEDDTELVFEPDQGVNTSLANAGDFVEIPMTTNKFIVSSEKRILVAQYMVSAGAGFGQSDPSMVLAVGVDQWRADTLFHAPVTWQANYADIIAPQSASVSVDGVTVPDNAFDDIPNTDYKVAHVNLDNGGDGNHMVEADEPVSVSVYGVQSFGSYWAVGGLDLEHF